MGWILLDEVMPFRRLRSLRRPTVERKTNCFLRDVGLRVVQLVGEGANSQVKKEER